MKLKEKCLEYISIIYKIYYKNITKTLQTNNIK